MRSNPFIPINTAWKLDQVLHVHSCLLLVRQRRRADHPSHEDRNRRGRREKASTSERHEQAVTGKVAEVARETAYQPRASATQVMKQLIRQIIEKTKETIYGYTYSNTWIIWRLRWTILGSSE